MYIYIGIELLHQFKVVSVDKMFRSIGETFIAQVYW
jgi:hypothetical protein